MGNYTILRCSKILGEAGKQEILLQMFRKFYISNRVPNKYFPKIDFGCPCNMPQLLISYTLIKENS